MKVKKKSGTWISLVIKSILIEPKDEISQNFHILLSLLLRCVMIFNTRLEMLTKTETEIHDHDFQYHC